MASGQLVQVLQYVRSLIGPRANVDRTDAQLLEQFVAGHDSAAFATLMQRHGPMVWGVCRGILRDRADAEDAFQAVFLVLVRRAGSLHGRIPLGGWLHTVACRISLKAKARSARCRAREREAVTVASRDPRAEIDDRETHAVLHEELHRLPDKYRLPLVLCYLEDQTQEQAARDLGLPAGSMSKRLNQARTLLKKRLNGRGVTLPATGLAAILGEQATASVPPLLAASTLRAALVIAMGRAATGGASASVGALMEGALHAMFLSKLKTVLGLTLFLIAAGIGAGLLVERGLSTEPIAGAVQAPGPVGPAPEEAKPAVESLPGARTDEFGDPLPPAALARLGTLRLRHGGVVWQTAFSPDSKTIVSASQGGVHFWDVARGTEVRRLAAPEFGGYVVALSPDGKAIATTMRGRLCLVDWASGKVLRRFEREQDPDMMVAFSPAGSLLASWGNTSAVRLWDVDSGKQRPPLRHAERISNAVFSPDSKRLAVGCWKDPLIHLWDVAASKEVQPLRGHTQDVLAVAYSPDGKVLASTGNDSTLRFWDTDTGKELRRVKNFRGSLPLAFAPDGKTVASGTYGDGICLWDPATGNLVRKLERKGRGPLGYLTFSPDGKYLASMWNGVYTFDLWDMSTGIRLHSSTGHPDGVKAVAFSPDGEVLATGGTSNGTPDGVRLWEPDTGKEIRRYGNHNFIEALAFSPDGRLVASGSNAAILLFDRVTDRLTGKLEGHGNTINSLAFSADGKVLASRAQDKTIRIWNVAARKQLLRIDLADDWPGRLALSADGKIVAAGASEATRTGLIHLWDAATGKELRRLQGHQGSVHGLAFAADGKTLASAGGDATIRLWDVSAGRELRRFTGHQSWVHFVAFTPDGRALASGGGDQSVRLWELASGQERCRFAGHHGTINTGSFSADGKRLATASEDTTVLVWDIMGAAVDQRASSSAQLANVWKDLAAADAAKAYRALCTLLRAPEPAVLLLRKHLHPVGILDASQQKLVQQWIADLDGDNFTRRRQATQQLERLGELAAPELRNALKAKHTLEAKKRMERVLDQLQGVERLRLMRAVELLEHAATRPARQLLTELAGGAAGAFLTLEATTALERLARRSQPALMDFPIRDKGE